MSISSILKKNPVLVTKETSLKETAKKMLEANVGSVVVVETEEEARPCGIVTDRDIALKLAEDVSVNNLFIKDIVQPQLIILREDKSLKDLTRAFRNNKIRRVVVVDDHDKVTGVASLDDLLILISDELNDIKKAVEGQISW